MDYKEFDKATIFSFGNIIDYASDAIVSKTIMKKETGNVSLFSFAKGQELSEHTAPFDALVQVVDGKAEIIINGKSHFLETGNSIIMPANNPHAVKAMENFKMILTMIKS
ncbi:MAG: cupin domain-containing protein [Lentimicrobiaceae bacterium]|nr:cupin domain-containing protein [Lentimicrobiaceae bacterium]